MSTRSFSSISGGPSGPSWRRPWELLPRPVTRAAIWCWELLPDVAHEALGPIGDLLNPGHRTGPTAPMPGADTVSGVSAIRAEGFTPIEELTGRTEIAVVWPEPHRRSVVESRPWWIDEQPEGRLWLVRSPWPSLTVDEALSCVWSYTERDGGAYLQMDESTQLALIGEVLTWPEAPVDHDEEGV